MDEPYLRRNCTFLFPVWIVFIFSRIRIHYLSALYVIGVSALQMSVDHICYTDVFCIERKYGNTFLEKYN